jgi:uncharacterized protein (TIGR00661 family)
VKILYGVVGEGMGHATRSRVVLEHLSQRHEVHIVVSGRASEYLAKRFPNVHPIWGFTIDYQGNAVNNLRTLVRNLKGAVAGWPANVRTYFELLEQFAPDVVVSDFESFSYLFGRNHFLPVISIDNMQIINRCRHDPALIAGHEDSFELTRALVKSKLPGCAHYFITTFFKPEVRKARTTLVPSILRPEILEAKSEPGEHLLVYQTMTTNQALLDGLRRSGLPCRIYGVRRDLKEDLQDGNLCFRPFSEQGFIDDLRTSRAVVAGGGYTLMSESVALHKPMLSVPVAGQFEQVLNAKYLEQLGFGLYAKDLEGDALERFLERLPSCEVALRSQHQDGNRELLARLDAALAQAREKPATWDDATEG